MCVCLYWDRGTGTLSLKKTGQCTCPPVPEKGVVRMGIAYIINTQRYPSPNPRIDVFLVTYVSDGYRVKGFLAVPKWEANTHNGKFPGFLYLRGGIKGVGMVRMGRIIQFASEGFVVMAPFYRGNCGGEGYEDFAGEDRKDALAGFHVLVEHPLVDYENIHVFGFSRGGAMALITAIEEPTVKSVVTWGGVSDMVLTYEERVDLRRMMKRVIGGTPTKVPEQYKWRTPLEQISKMKAPVLIIHGAQDKNVSVNHAYLLENKLKEHNKRYTKWIFEEYTHYFPPEVNRKVVQDLTKWMKNC